MAELFNSSSVLAMPGMFTPDDSQFLISLDDAFPPAVDEQAPSMPAPGPAAPVDRRRRRPRSSPVEGDP